MSEENKEQLYAQPSSDQASGDVGEPISEVTKIQPKDQPVGPHSLKPLDQPVGPHGSNGL